MRWLPLLALIILVYKCHTKDMVSYQANGADLFDLIRGAYKGPLKLTRVEGDGTSLPDGIYFLPEDVPLSDKEPKELYINGKNKLRQ